MLKIIISTLVILMCISTAVYKNEIAEFTEYISFPYENNTCGESSKSRDGTFNNDLIFLNTYTRTVVLKSDDGSDQLIITPEFQGRVMTSTASGLEGISNAWINYDFIEKMKINNGGNPYGGEDRLWIGPLGGQYSLYYQQIKPLSEENWYVPDALSKGTYTVITQSGTHIEMFRRLQLKNFIGTVFNAEIKRKITILDDAFIKKELKISSFESCDVIAYESVNELTNTDTVAWSKSTGLLSLWHMGMFRGSDDAFVWIPIKNNIVGEPLTYFGPLSDKRLKKDKSMIQFMVDGKYRSKIGIPLQLTQPIFYCLDKSAGHLTVIKFNFNKTDSLYFNSKPFFQENPYSGEVISVYNDGTMDYSQSNESSFYELETASAMKELESGNSMKHKHFCVHFTGDSAAINKVFLSLLSVDFCASHI